MEAFFRICQSFSVKLVGKIVIPLGGVRIFQFFFKYHKLTFLILV